MFIDQNGNPYFGDMRPGDREATPDEVNMHTSNNGVEFKKLLLMGAHTMRDSLLWHLERYRTRAVEANDATALDAIDAAIASLEGLFDDPRIVSAVNGGVKLQARIVYLEIANALKIAHQPTYDAISALYPA